MYSLALDPSINNVGWSILDLSSRTKNSAWQWGTWKLEGPNLERRIMDLVEYIEELLPPGSEGEPGFSYLITEYPTFFSSEIGHVAAHQSYTIDLAAISFFVAGWYRMDHRKHFAITANTWKGSVPKEVTARRFFQAFPKVKAGTLSEHAIDSVMMHRFWVENYAIQMRRVLKNNTPESLLSLC